MESVGEFEYSKADMIGNGAFAVVFKGRYKKKQDKPVAIKSITKSRLAKSQSLLSKEIKILKELSCLQHENVVHLLDCKETSHHVYLVMEYCNGGDLADYLQKKGTLSEDTLSSFFKQIARAMVALNNKGIVHRDMKPQNILLCKSQPNPPPQEIRLKIADFGFARFLQDGVMAATLCGSPMYMAPEVIMSLQYDAKADLWSVGTILYQCLTGKAPFQAQTPQQLKQLYERNADLKPNIPSGTSPELKDLLLCLLKRNVKDRIGFDDFYKHPFHQSRCSSSPVPVPRSQSRGSSLSSDSPSLKAVSSSPLSGHAAASPPRPIRAVQKIQDDAQTINCGSSPNDVGDFLKVHKDSLNNTPTRGSPVEDFVMLPEEMQTDDVQSPATVRAQPPRSVQFQSPANSNQTTPTTSAFATTSPSAGSASPSRPSYLPGVQSPAGSPSSGRAIPVPSAAFRKQMKRIHSTPSIEKSPDGVMNTDARTRRASASGFPMKQVAGNPHGIQSSPKQIMHVRKTSNSSQPDVSSMSPPNVRFSVGTPPSAGNWMRIGSQVETTPPGVTSPMRKSGQISPSPRMNTPPFGGPSSLPNVHCTSGKIVHAPRLMPTPEDDLAIHQAQHQNASSFSMRPNQTCPGNIAAVGYFDNENKVVPMTYGTDFRRNSGSSNRLSDQLFGAAFGPSVTPPAGFHNLRQSPQGHMMMVPFAGSNPTLSRNNSIGSSQAVPIDRTSYRQHRNSEGDHVQICFATPPKMSDGFPFRAPELAEETLMDKEHVETVSKLSYVLDLVECLQELSQTRSSPLAQSLDQRQGNHQVAALNKKEEDTSDIHFVAECQRHMEQLVIQVRVLELLKSSIELAQEEIAASRLQASTSVKRILKEMAQHYQQSLSECRQLHSLISSSRSSDIETTNANKLIYFYAMEMCKTAALDEIFGNQQECFRQYRIAQILLHSLAQQVLNQEDREVLNRRKITVEQRLFNLTSQGYIQAYERSW